MEKKRNALFQRRTLNLNNGEKMKKNVFAALTVLAISFFVSSCGKENDNQIQGYIEGDFLYIGSPSGGILEKLAVEKGENVKTGTLLFSLDSSEAGHALGAVKNIRLAVQSMIVDMSKGQRPEDIDVSKGLLASAKAFREGSEIGTERETIMWKGKATSEREYLIVKHIHEVAVGLVSAVEAFIKVQQMGQRADKIKAAESVFNALGSLEKLLERKIELMSRRAPSAAFVYQTIYKKGEFVPSGKAVVVLLPPENVKARFFIPRNLLDRFKPGQTIKVRIDGDGEAQGKINYISPKAEYTPPFIYSESSSEKFVYMAEAIFPPETARKLHPGQPVTIEF